MADDLNLAFMTALPKSSRVPLQFGFTFMARIYEEIDASNLPNSCNVTAKLR